MSPGYRPISSRARCSSTNVCTAFHRCVKVAQPSPYSPGSVVSIFTTTSGMPCGAVTIALTARIRMSSRTGQGWAKVAGVSCGIQLSNERVGRSSSYCASKPSTVRAAVRSIGTSRPTNRRNRGTFGAKASSRASVAYGALVVRAATKKVWAPDNDAVSPNSIARAASRISR